MMATCNPFRVGDKVMVTGENDPYGILQEWFDLTKMYTVWGICSDNSSKVILAETGSSIHYTHLKLYKEPTQEKQPMKTKRIPFSEEAYNKYKDVAKVWLGSCECERFAFMTNGKGCVGDGEWSQGFALYSPKGDTDVYHHSVWAFELEIPITTKRIPFNPELKAAKVVCRHTSDELSEWVYMMSGVVCGVIKHEGGDYTTKLYHPNTLQMEIEEDV